MKGELAALLSPTPPPCPVLTLAAWPYLCPSHQTGSAACAQKQVCRRSPRSRRPWLLGFPAPQVVREGLPPSSRQFAIPHPNPSSPASSWQGKKMTSSPPRGALCRIFENHQISRPFNLR